MAHQPQDRSGRGALASLSGPPASPEPGGPETIVAVATAPGMAGIAVVRLSGPLVPQIVPALLGRLPRARHATLARFLDAAGDTLDTGLALYFPAPASYTGEAVLELHCHGGPVIVESLTRRALQLGCRRAEPGEFTRRAYLNGRLDLAQAEAVADLIGAASEAAARAAQRSLAGELSARVQTIAEGLAVLRARVEAAIDFAGEDLPALAPAAVRERLEALSEALLELRGCSERGRLLTEGLTVVIAGPPNAGKSTLMNRLTGADSSIVTPIPGTTRDLLRERVQLDGLPLLLIDSAGLRAAPDPIESEGIRRARAAMSRADRILFVIDATGDLPAGMEAAGHEARQAAVPLTVVINKIDLLRGVRAPVPTALAGPDTLAVSALTGEGLDALREHLKRCAGFAGPEVGALSARGRHLDALDRAARHVREARAQLDGGAALELLAEELRLAQASLGEITGEGGSEELLTRIFSTFCIGK